MDEGAAIVGGDDFSAMGKGRFDFLHFLFDTINHIEGIFAGTHDDDAADHFSLAVQFSDAPAKIGTQMDGAEVANPNRNSGLRFDRNILNVRDAFNVAATAHVILGGGDVEDFAADIPIGGANLI